MISLLAQAHAATASIKDEFEKKNLYFLNGYLRETLSHANDLFKDLPFFDFPDGLTASRVIMLDRSMRQLIKYLKDFSAQLDDMPVKEDIFNSPIDKAMDLVLDRCNEIGLHCTSQVAERKRKL